MNRHALILIATLLGLAVVPALPGCSPPPPADATDTDATLDGTGAPTAEVGTGQLDWEEIPQVGAELELIYGPQGGYHVWGRARFRGLQPDVDVTIHVTRLEDDRLMSNVLTAQRRWIDPVMMVRRGLLDLGNGEYVTNAEQLILMIRCADEIVGKRVRLDLTVVERATGRMVTDSREAVVVDQVSPMMCAGMGGGGDGGADGDAGGRD